MDDSKVWSSLEKKLAVALDGERLRADVIDSFPDPETLSSHVEKRIQFTLEHYYRLRHGGTLRAPSELVPHRSYSRPEAINHFGFQYDPAVHNAGVITFKPESAYPDEIVLITKIDTSGAKSDFQYQNRFEDPTRFHWQSQNKQTQDNASGRYLLEHQKFGRRIHLFVQAKSHAAPHYMGIVDVASVSGNAPMNVVFNLRTSITPVLYDLLGS